MGRLLGSQLLKSWIKRAEIVLIFDQAVIVTGLKKAPRGDCVFWGMIRFHAGVNHMTVVTLEILELCQRVQLQARQGSNNEKIMRNKWFSPHSHPVSDLVQIGLSTHEYWNDHQRHLNISQVFVRSRHLCVEGPVTSSSVFLPQVHQDDKRALRAPLREGYWEYKTEDKNKTSGISRISIIKKGKERGTHENLPATEWPCKWKMWEGGHRVSADYPALWETLHMTKMIKTVQLVFTTRRG